MLIAPCFPISLGCRPTYCFKYGGGECLCTGDGVITDICRQRTTATLLLMCPPESKARKLLINGLLFVRFSGATGAPSWHHIGLMYLNPQRPTYLQVRQVDHQQARGRVVFQVPLADSLPVCHTDVEATQCIDAQAEARASLFCLIGVDMGMQPFSLGRQIYAEPLDHFCHVPGGNRIRFWMGQPWNWERRGGAA